MRATNGPRLDLASGLGRPRVRADRGYQETERGALVADLDEPQDRPASQAILILGPIRRVDRLFTMKLDQLRATWSAAASEYKATRHDAGKPPS
jgi:hypothetical protein